MSGEWLKSSVADLIKAYKSHENLYDPKHKLYYNKQARNVALQKILNAIKKNRPDTNLHEINKKIQSLRTQFGQEIQKVEKSRSLGEDLIYRPKIWWFQHLEWIGDFMKTRHDPNPLSKTIKLIPKTENSPIKTLNESLEYAEDEIDDSEEYTFMELEDSEEPAAKRIKTYQSPKIVESTVDQFSSIPVQQEIESDTRTIEYTLINEDTSEIVPSVKKQFHEIHEADERDKQQRLRRRSKALGKYIATLMMDIADDKLFFETQRDITNSIHEANMKQLQCKRS